MKSIGWILIFFQSAAWAEWKMGGSTGPYINAFQFSSRNNVPAQKAGIQLDLKLDKKFKSNWRLRSDTWIRTDFKSPDKVEQLQWNLKNLYLQKKGGGLTYRIGFQTLSIDGPDLMNPADVIHSKNWIDPSAPVTLGSAGISLSQESGDWNWELFYVPSQTRPVLPGEHSPWLPRENRLPIESADTELRIPNDVNYQYLSPTELDDATKHNVTAKIQYKSDSFESQLVYFNGLSQNPFLLTEINATLIAVSPKQILLVDSPVKLRPLYYRHEAVAGTFVLPFESWAIRGGFNWLKPRQNDNRVPSETSMAVVGIEKNIETSWGMVTGIVEHVRQRRLDENQISFLRSVMEDAWTVGLRIPWGDETSFLVGGIYDRVGRSSVYKGAITHRLSNSWSVEAGAQYLHGPTDTLLGIYRRYDSYHFKALYSW
jgi:hypothetical protein